MPAGRARKINGNRVLKFISNKTSKVNTIETSGHHKTMEGSCPSVDLNSPANSIKAIPGIRRGFDLQQASAVVHEVRNPLNNINLSVQMLEAVLKDGDLKIYLDIIKRSSARINFLISELLKEEEPVEAQVGKYSMHQLLDEVIELAGDQMALKHITITKDFTGDDYKTAMSRPQIKMALTNIVMNAIEAMPPCDGELKLVTKSIGYNYEIQIADNGCGINKEHLKYIFKPYFTNKPGGCGLGLAIVYEILRINNIRVNVASAPGKGTCFILLFGKSRYSPFERKKTVTHFPGTITEPQAREK